MKKKLALVLSFLLLFLTAFGCGAKRIAIEDYRWVLRYAMHGEDGNLVVDATGQEESVYPDAKRVDIILTAKDGSLTVADVTNGKTYEGTYAVESRTPEGTNYRVVIDGKTGYAAVAMTTYGDGTQEPTLPISLDGYSLSFYAQ